MDNQQPIAIPVRTVKKPKAVVISTAGMTRKQRKRLLEQKLAKRKKS